MEEKKIVSLEDDIEDKANLLIGRINEEIEYLQNKSLKKYKAGLEEETTNYRESELAELKLSTSSEISVSKFENKRNLLKMREDYFEELFSEFEAKVIGFRDSDKYRDFLTACLDKYDYDYSKGVFFVRKEDVALMKEIMKARNVAAVIEEDYIKIGGFKFESKELNVLVEETLDSRMDSQKEWFRENSGFII